MRNTLDLIAVDAARTLHGLFRERVRRTPDAVAYRHFSPRANGWEDCTWGAASGLVGRWQAAFRREDLEPGDRIAIMARNSLDWVCCDQAAQSLGLVVVPLYARDRSENTAYMLGNAGAKLLVVGDAGQWQALRGESDGLSQLNRVVTLAPSGQNDDPRLRARDDWLPPADGIADTARDDPDEIATIVYTSGTTGRPKGVMLSHANILSNAAACLARVPVYREDLLLSFLPLSHMLERTVGYYLPMMAGATVAFARSVSDLQEDLLTVRPTTIVSVPLIYERIEAGVRDIVARGGRPATAILDFAIEAGWSDFERRQGRRGRAPIQLLAPLARAVPGRALAARLGGRLRFAVSGGAALPPETAKMFLGLGVTVIQGYGLTETSPVVSLNTPDDNAPATVGRPIDGTTVRIGDDQTLEVGGPGLMLGYWRNEKATAEIMTPDGWFKTGDQVRIEDGRLTIVGRTKDVLVLANGEKVAPDDMERAIVVDPLFDQALIVGNDRPYLTALIVLDDRRWQEFAAGPGLPFLAGEVDGDPRSRDAVLKRIEGCLHGFPGYARVRDVAIAAEGWTVENGLLTPTRKKRKTDIIAAYRDRIDALYSQK